MSYANANIFKEKTVMGKILFALSCMSILLLAYIAVKYPFLSVDEWYTWGIIKLGLHDSILATANDVHPPLYYIILKVFVKIFTAMKFDMILSMTVASIIPYIIILAVCITHVRKNFGWFVCGAFSFALLAMSDFFTQYLTARMYSWGILFLILAILCVKQILDKNNLKDWILLSFFTLLSVYTHYILAITLIVIYLLLFIYTLKKENASIKNWIISAAISIGLYIPWMGVVVSQFISRQSYGSIVEFSYASIFNCLSYLFTSIVNPIAIGLFSILAIICMLLIFKAYRMEKNDENFFMLFCALTTFLTLISCLIFSCFSKNILIGRYIVPVAAIFWLSIALYLDRFENKKIIIAGILILLAFGCINVSEQFVFINHQHDLTMADMEFISSIDNNDTAVILPNKYVKFHDFFNKTDKYYTLKTNNKTVKSEILKILNVKFETFVLPDDLDKTKNVYIAYDYKKEIENTTEYTYVFKHTLQNNKFYKIERTGQ